MCKQGCEKEEGEKEDILHMLSIDGNPLIPGVDRYISCLCNKLNWKASFYSV